MLSAVLVMAGLSFAQSASELPKPGTLISWRFEFDGAPSTRLSEIIASGPDFVIYQPDLKYEPTSAASYIVEFSGIHAQSCGEPLPDAADRQALRSMWPLQPGASATVRKGAAPSKYSVGTSQRFDFISGTSLESAVMRVDGQVGGAEFELFVSPDFGMPIGIDWAAGGKGRVLEIIEPKTAFPAAPQQKNLGNCASLLRPELSN